MHFTTALTLLSSTNLFTILLLFPLLSPYVASRQVHHHLLYTPPTADELLVGGDRLDEWAGVQGFHTSLRHQIDPTPSRQYARVSPTIAIPHRVSDSQSDVIPTTAPVVSNVLQRRGSFTSNVCPISIQTTIIISVDGTSTVTVSSIVGPRSTGIPGDTGTSDGVDPSGGSTDNGTVGGAGFSDKEGLITGLVIVVVILLASICALVTYFYKKRRNARIQRLSMRQGADPAELVRRMGSKGIMSLSNPGRTIRRPHLPSPSIPIAVSAFFARAIRRLKASVTRGNGDSQRDSQSSELLEWKRQMGRQHERWSEVDGEKYVSTTQPRRDGESQKSLSPPTVPEVITSPAISAVGMPSSANHHDYHSAIGSRSSAGSSSNRISTDFVPFVQRKVSSQHLATARLSAVRPTIEPVKLGSTPDLRRSGSPTRRNSRGEPLSPSAWMAGFGLGSNPNVVDPFNNPSYVSSSEGGHHQRYSYQSSGLSGENMASPRSGAGSLSSDKTTRGRAPSPPGQYQQMTRGVPLSVVVEHGGSDVRLDGASDIMSTFGSAFGDRPESIRSTATSYNEHHYNAAAADQAQIARYHALSDVEEVLTPVADERLSLRPGQSLPWRSTSTYNSRSRGGSVSSPPRPLQETASSSPSSPQFDHPLRQPPVDPLSTDTTTTTTEFRNPFASDENVEVQQRSLSPPPRHHQQSHHQHHPSLSLYRQHHQHHASDADLANAAAMIPPVPPSGVRGRRTPGPGAYRRKSEATSLSGILPSDVSVAASGTGTSIVERPPSLDTSEWDDLALRRQQEERLFFSASVESAVRSDSK